MICAIVLAAGRSERMGTQKLLLPYAGTTLVGHIVDEALAAGMGQVIVVISEHTQAVRVDLAGRPVTFAANPDPTSDMLSSVRCGLRAIPAECSAVAILLGDQPSVTAGLLGEMARAFVETGRGIVVPVHGGRRGHPILFSVRYCGELLSRFEGVGLRGLLQAHPDEVHELSVPAPAVLLDLDVPADYLRETGQLPPRGRPP